MTIQRDLAWQYLNHLYQSSVAHNFARYAMALTYESLPQEVSHQAKRCVLDALGCAIGAYDAPGRPIFEGLVQDLEGPKEATMFGSGARTSALNAALANSFLVRFLDYNDLGGGGHNSDSIPSIFAIAEREKASGRNFLTSVVISYELGQRLSEGSGAHDSNSIPQKVALNVDSRGGFNMPPALGKLMGLNEDQIANAIGICASHANPLNILDTNLEENFMAKNLRFGWVAHDAILSCLLAKRGFTGPVRVAEGEGGYADTALNGKLNLERLLDFSNWKILGARFKYICANVTTHGHVMATMAIVKENNLKPEDIAAVRIKAGRREALHTTTLSKKYPRNAESADHSAYYANAIAIKERAFGPEAFDPRKFTDPVVLDLIEKITVEIDPSMPEGGFQGMSEITTKDGRRFQKRVDVPHGMMDDPLTDAELEEKFTAMATKYMSPTQIKEIFSTIWDLENQPDVGKLARLMVFPTSH